MLKLDNLILLIFLSQLISINSTCIPYQENCEVCHPLNNLCIKCLADNYFPDKNGGCEPKCTVGKNYCENCSEDSKICSSCEEGYFPDKIGGCSFIPNCKESYRGKCLNCVENFVLIGYKENFQICKSIYSDDLKHCSNYSLQTGLCFQCEEGFYLNKGDYKCSETNYCFESIYGICSSCIEGYYLNKKENKCEKEDENFINCKETLDGKNCEECNFGFYLAEDGKCTNALMCSETQNGKCIKCVDNFYLTEDKCCTTEEKCQYGDGKTALCDYCISGYYLDKKDNKCKIQDREEVMNCDVYLDGCIECDLEYFKGEDLKCSKTKNCHESQNGKCLQCKEEYYLGHDNKCSPVEHCIYSGEMYECDECEDGYYFSVNTKTCLKSEENFQNCKISIFDGSKCESCKNNYYLNRTDYLCYDNTDENDKFYRCKYTDYKGEICDQCIEGYFMTSGDERCIPVNNCKYSENDICKVCDNGYCLDVKKNECFDNDFMENENQIIYIACNKTNEEGDKCEICLEGYEVNENGYCIDNKRCEEKGNAPNEICIKCKDDDTILNGYYCANKVFGCLKYFMPGCKQCNDLEDLYSCTECHDGYTLNGQNRCIRNE